MDEFLISVCLMFKFFPSTVFEAPGLIFHGPGELKEENKLCQSIGKPRRKVENTPHLEGVCEIPGWGGTIQGEDLSEAPWAAHSPWFNQRIKPSSRVMLMSPCPALQ